jgi:hypothetical protein
MGWTRWGPGLDTRIGDIAERAARKLNRRDAIRGAVVTGTAGLASLSLGRVPARAATDVACQCGPTRRCAGCPETHEHRCPKGHHLCRGSSTSNCFNKQGYRCEWPNASWIACMNLGKGHGYKVCYDCIGHKGCKDWCTCLSRCVCCDCTSAADLKAEQQRLASVVLTD